MDGMNQLDNDGRTDGSQQAPMQTMQQMPMQQIPMQNVQPRILVVSTKNLGLSIVLTFFFGPLGMLYSTITGAIVMFLVSLVIGLVTFGLGLFITWPICMIWGAMAVNSYNKKLGVATV